MKIVEHSITEVWKTAQAHVTKIAEQFSYTFGERSVYPTLS